MIRTMLYIYIYVILSSIYILYYVELVGLLSNNQYLYDLIGTITNDFPVFSVNQSCSAGL